MTGDYIFGLPHDCLHIIMTSTDRRHVPSVSQKWGDFQLIIYLSVYIKQLAGSESMVKLQFADSK